MIRVSAVARQEDDGLLAILVEHQKTITQLRERIQELESAMRPPLTLTPEDPAA